MEENKTEAFDSSLNQSVISKTSKKDKKKKNSIIGYIVSILCLLLCLYITVEVVSATNESRPPVVFNLSVSYVPTESMKPTIPGDSYILFKGASISDLKPGKYDTPEENHENESGDIVVYYSNTYDKYIIHRVVGEGVNSETGKRYLITWGDNNDTVDPEEVTASMVYGEYVTNLAVLSIFSGGIKKNWVYFILIIMFILMIGMQVSSMIVASKTKKLKEEKKEEKKELLEDLKLQIMKEELERIKEYNLKQQQSTDNKDQTVEETETNDKADE